jgi:hypothetical protein
LTAVSDDLLREAHQVDYRLRSTFFYRKLHELGFVGFRDQIDALVELEDNYDWTNRDEWGISPTAWEYIANASLSPVRVFAHPRVLIEQPQLIAYYRGLAVLSQKAVSRLAFSVQSYEAGRNRSPLPHKRALELCQLFNTHISTIIDSTLVFSERDLDALLYASAGSQIDGSWRNAIGAEAEMVVKRLIISALAKEGHIVAHLDKDNRPIRDVPAQYVLEHLSDYNGVLLSNRTSLLFGAEPDMTFRRQDGRVLGALEVKGGKDPAGALERYGAAKKTFDELRHMEDDPEIHTIFLASCITPEVEVRIRQDKTISTFFNLTEILAYQSKREAFISYVKRLVRL